MDDREVAKLLAGLDDAALSDLAAQHESQPQFPRAPWVRMAPALAVGLLLAGAAISGLAYEKSFVAFATVCLTGSMLAALAVGGAAVFDNLRLAPAMRNYRRLGLFAAVLDEFHPWLFETHVLRLHPAAEDYRRQVISQRGAVRGVDCVMMKAIIRARDALEGTRPSAALAREVQLP